MWMKRQGEARERAPARPSRRDIGPVASLVLLATLPVLIVIAVLAAAAGWRDAGEQSQADTARLNAAATTVAAALGQAAASGDRAGAAAALKALTATPGVAYARIERADGATLAETGRAAPLKRDVQAGAKPFAWLKEADVEVSAPVMAGPRRVGEVVLVAEGRGLADRLIQNLKASFIAALLALGTGLGLALWLRDRLGGAPAAVAGSIDTITTGAEPDPPGELGAAQRRIAELEDAAATGAAELELALRAAADKARTETLAAVAREIGAPLRGISALARLIDAGELSPRQRRHAETIARSGASLALAVGEMGQTPKPALAAVDVAALAEDVASLYWTEAAAKGLDLAVYADPGTPAKVQGDPILLRQALAALVNQAIQSTRAGGVLVEVEPDAAGSLRISVRDTGPGAPKDEIAAWFDGARPALALAKAAVEAMGGRFSISTAPEKGTTLAFRLPAAAVEPAPAWPAAKTAGLKVRILHDGIATRRALGRYLARAGYGHAPEGSEDEVALVVGAAAKLGRARTATPTFCLAPWGDSAPHELLKAGAAHARVAQPIRREALAALLADLTAGAELTDDLAPDTARPAQSLPSFAGARVLVADDDPVARETTMAALARLSVQTVLAADGAEAAKAAEVGSYDLILMDDAMPGLDGYEAARRIRAFETGQGVRRTPIIALTPPRIGAEARAWVEAGMDAVLHKPFDAAGLGRALAEFIEPAAVPAIVISPASPAPAVAIAIDPRLIDPKVAAAMAAMAAEGKADAVVRVQTLYRDNAPTLAENVRAAIENGEMEASAKAAHALKAMSLNIGAREVARLADRIEEACRAGHAPPREAAEELHVALKATLAALAQPLVAQPLQPAPNRITTVAAQTPPEIKALLDDLDEAIATDQLAMVYQPQVDRDGQNITGVEALVRWTHPKRGFVSPADFIPMAEAWGQIGKVTDWVMHRACLETLDIEGLQVGFNASALEFTDADIVTRIEKAVARTGFDPRRLEVEITETAILENEDQVRDNMSALRAMGMKVALDDFGAGYSSLGHLRRYAFDKLKIDREFVIDCTQDVQSATVVHAVVSIGRALGMKVVAEGVETEQQRQFLRIAGVHAMQGYLFGRPMPIVALKETLATAKAMKRA